MSKLTRLSFLIVLCAALILVVTMVAPTAAQTAEPPAPQPPIVISTAVPETPPSNALDSANQTRKPFTSSTIITDEQFVSGEPSDELEIQAKLEELNSPLASMNLEPVEGFSIPAASALAYLSEVYSVSPSVLLTLAEKELGLLSNSAAIGSSSTLSEWLRNTAQQLSTTFYDAYYSEQPFTASSSALGRETAVRANPGSYALEEHIALRAATLQNSDLEDFRKRYAEDFTITYAKYFGNPLRGQKRLEHPDETSATSAQPQLWLPWTGGEIWNYNGGPHPFSAGGVPDQRLFSGVDFQPKGYAGLKCKPMYIAERWVTASAAGKPIDYQTYWIKIDSDSDNKLTTGWQIVYGHVANRIGTSVTAVTRGQRLGNPSCYGGTATGVHVHFGLKYQNLWQVADGKVVSGWKIRNGQEAYHGYMEKSGATTRQSSYRPGGSYNWSQSELTSDNYPGSSTPTCSPGADQVAVYVNKSYTGQCVVRNVGNYSNPGAIGLPNDSASSIKVGSNVILRLYEHDNYNGRSSSFTSNDSDLSNNTIGDNSVSSMKVERRSSPNLALNRSAYATSQEASYAGAAKANDGNSGTRWSSRHSSSNTNELWRVDLGSGTTFDRVQIRWETAYARRYFVGWSDDGWNFTGYWFTDSSAAYRQYNLGTRKARYAGVYMTEHAPCCANYSLWEFEVFRSGTLSEGLPEGELGAPDELSGAMWTEPISELVTIRIPANTRVTP